MFVTFIICLKLSDKHSSMTNKCNIPEMTGILFLWEVTLVVFATPKFIFSTLLKRNFTALKSFDFY